ncbi:uncharacterized protein LOC143232206 isoform X3 [Tachypleus tridentatus]|uniref:uncharacterized protein LOC143232206 isoform X3 n=1 Tax=Tachypleus tridentatus TaxID=6853 RepID=UPI003FD16839
METGRVFGVGPGVFIVAVIWSLAVFVFLAVSRTKRAGAKFKSLGECAAHVMLSNYITRELVQAVIETKFDGNGGHFLYIRD